MLSTFTHLTDLGPVLGAPRWCARSSPFPHVVASDVFHPDFYARLVRDFRALVERDGGAGYNGKHDFYGASLLPGRCGALGVFLSPAWYALARGLFGVSGPGYVTAGVHRHAPGSRDGFVHNDIHPESLAPSVATGEAVRHGETDVTERAVRAVAVLFYLNNGAWSPGDGGETGLYHDWKDPLGQPVATAPPRDNTLLAFACHPHSYHSFRANRRRRDSVISFIYQDLAAYLHRWGPEGVRQYAEFEVRDV